MLSNGRGRISKPFSAQEAQLPEYLKEAIITRLKTPCPGPF